MDKIIDAHIRPILTICSREFKIRRGGRDDGLSALPDASGCLGLTSRGDESLKYCLEQDPPSIRAAALRGATRLANAISEARSCARHRR